MSITSASKRAAQIWSVLGLAARNRQILTYQMLGKLIGVPARGLGYLLEPIQSYCLLNELPPSLSSLSSYWRKPGYQALASARLPLVS